MKKKIQFRGRFNDVFIDKKVKTGGVMEEYTAVITPSGQFWNGLSSSEQEEWRGKVREAGENPEDPLAYMRRMLPQSPKGAE